MIGFDFGATNAEVEEMKRIKRILKNNDCEVVELYGEYTKDIEAIAVTDNKTGIRFMLAIQMLGTA